MVTFPRRSGLDPDCHPRRGTSPAPGRRRNYHWTSVTTLAPNDFTHLQVSIGGSSRTMRWS